MHNSALLWGFVDSVQAAHHTGNASRYPGSRLDIAMLMPRIERRHGGGPARLQCRPAQARNFLFRMNIKPILRGLPILLSLAALGFVVHWSGLGEMLDQGWIDREVRGKGFAGELLFVGIGALAIGVGFPRQLVSFMSGYAFGFLYGTWLALVATLLGCAGGFFYARLFARSLVAHHLGGRIARVDGFVRDNPFTMTLLIRLLPVGSNLATNLAGGVSSVPALPFLLGSGLGFVPQTAVFALVGSGVSVDPLWRIGLGTVLFVVSGVLGIYLYQSLRRNKVYDEGLEREIEDRI